MESTKKIAKRDQEVAALAREYRQKKGSIDEGFYQELQKFSDANPMFDTKARTVVKTGTSNGRKVVQYSDGTIEYAE
jgi:hypothetical protein